MAEKTTSRAVAGFAEDGRRYVVRDVDLVEAADSFLFNDLMYMKIDHRGNCDFGHTMSGGPFFLQPDGTRYSEGFRCAFVRDDETGKFWSAPYDPVQVEPDAFEFAPGVSDIIWRNTTSGICTEMRLVIPLGDTVELWTFTVTNASKRRRRVSMYPFFPMGFLADLLNECTFDRRLGGIIYKYFPYYVAVAGYYRNAGLKNAVFCVADRRGDSWQADLDDFKGGRQLSDPAQLHEARLARQDAKFENGAAIFQYAFDLAPGESRTVNLIFGPAKSVAEAVRLKARYLSRGGVERALASAAKFHEKHSSQVRVETPDADFNHFVNHWLPKQALWIGRTLRSSFGPCARNAITDAMGITCNDPDRARYWYTRIWAHQERRGWIPHGLPMVKGVSMAPINTIPHRDMNVWGPHAIYTYVTETGDESILDAKIPFSGSREKASLYEHVCIGLDWLLRDRTKRGLSRIGQGDWCDPLNMAGHKLKGESVMLTMNLAWALDIWAKVADRRGDSRRAARYRQEAGNCRRAINRHAWDGKWYVRGTTDEGKPFGSSANREGRLWLNPQGWAIICAAATPKRRAAAMQAVERYLWTPSGPTMLAPAYSPFHEDIGKITVKNPGIDENAAVYNSAVCWYAYAMYVARLAGEGWKYLRVILTGAGGNTIKRSGQLPLYVPNFYKGPAVGRDAGESSHYPGTGTAPWFYHTVVSMLFGLGGEFDGLRVDPQLPSAWKRAHVRRAFRGAEFRIEIKRSKTVSKTTVYLDGAKLPGAIVPLQRRGTRHTLLVLVP